MFAKYKISSTDILKIAGGQDKLKELIRSDRFRQWEKNQYAAYSMEVLNPLIFGDGGVIKARILKEQQFPRVNKHVFISHSGKDAKIAKVFAFILGNVGIDCFIDSMIWNNISTIQKQLDQRYCQFDKNKNTFNYKMRNNSTAHVHAILSTALFEMIDICECGIFIESENSSIQLDDIEGDTTFSPWIYEEINYLSKIRLKIPQLLNKDDIRYFSHESSQINESLEMKIAYPIGGVDELSELSADNVLQMLKMAFMCNRCEINYSGEEILEYLYKKTGLLKETHKCRICKKIIPQSECD